MKLAAPDIKSEGYLGGETVAMRLDENSLAHLMMVLSNLYSDPELAVIRELSVNARDSHIEAGQTRPIEISTPSWMSPAFRVQDFGVGLSLDGIKSIYSAYGASTKRDTNEQTGSLGLGSKSPLTLTDQFTVVSIKDGLKISLVVSRTETGGGTMQIVDTTATDEGNGVTIIVPVQQSHSFNEKVKQFFRFWQPGTVLVDGGEPDHDDDLIKVTDNIYMRPVARYGRRDKDYIIMGGIGYPTEKILPENTYRTFSIQAHVNIGDVAFTPSREELHYTEKTNAAIERINKEFRDNIGDVITREIEGAEDRLAAYNAYAKWEALVGGGNIAVAPTYKGETIPKNIVGKGAWYRAGRSGNSDKRTVEFQEKCTVSITSFLENQFYRPIFVVNLPKEQYTTYTKGKVRAYCELNSLRPNRVIFTNDKSFYENPWLPSDVTVLDWEDVKKAMRAPSQKRAANKQFPAFTGHGWENADIDTAKTTVYHVPSYDTATMDLRSLHHIYKGEAQFFKVTRNREERFKKLFPNAITMTQFATREKAKWADALKDHEIFRLHSAYPYWLENLPVEKVDDPEIREFVKASKEPSRHAEFNALNAALRHVHQKEIPDPPCPASPLKKYPLIDAINTWRTPDKTLINEVVTYMNGKFKELSS